MTNANLDLNKMGLTPLTEMEMQQVEGGNFWNWLGCLVNSFSLSVFGVTIIKGTVCSATM